MYVAMSLGASSFWREPKWTKNGSLRSTNQIFTYEHQYQSKFPILSSVLMLNHHCCEETNYSYFRRRASSVITNQSLKVPEKYLNCKVPRASGRQTF